MHTIVPTAQEPQPGPFDAARGRSGPVDTADVLLALLDARDGDAILGAAIHGLEGALGVDALGFFSGGVGLLRPAGGGPEVGSLSPAIREAILGLAAAPMRPSAAAPTSAAWDSADLAALPGEVVSENWFAVAVVVSGRIEAVLGIESTSRSLAAGDLSLVRAFGAASGRAMARQAECAAAVQRREAITQIVRHAAHELRTPLSTILGWSKLLLSGAGPANEETSRRCLEAIERAARAQAAHIDALVVETQRWTRADLPERPGAPPFEPTSSSAGEAVRAGRRPPESGSAPDEREVARPSSTPSVAPASPPRLDGLTVLVVDDNCDAREVFRLGLERRGARVVAAGSVREARDLLEAGPFDVLLSDIAMPDEDGLSLVSAARARHPTMRILAVSAFSDLDIIERALGTGADRYLTKPASPADIAVAVASVMGRVGAADG